MISYKIEDGRTSLYQWDIDRRLILEGAEAGYVCRFLMPGFKESLPVQAYDEDGVVFVNVPNILLQSNGTMTMYVFIPDRDGGFTKERFTILVNAQTRPADYVYTETEICTWVGLDKRISELEESSLRDSNLATDEDAIALLEEIGCIAPAMASENAVYTDNNGNVYTF